ncbi:EamA family transporter [Streptomyces sioyaensis]|uniref:EamA family transporter n=1 Tax=Streptomyces sioyaensis TaxID=67364 RepID=UPI0037D84D18
MWSTSFAVTKVLLDQLPPLTIGAVRFTAAAPILCVLVRMQSGWRPPPRRTVVKMLCAGLLGITAYFGLALQRASTTACTPRRRRPSSGPYTANRSALPGSSPQQGSMLGVLPE